MMGHMRERGIPMLFRFGNLHGDTGLCLQDRQDHRGCQTLLLLLMMATDSGISRSVPAMVAIRALAGSPAAGSMLVPATSHTG